MGGKGFGGLVLSFLNSGGAQEMAGTGRILAPTWFHKK
jgi:hypothetical protein